MSKKSWMIGMVTAAGLATSASAQVFTSTAVPASISDNSLTTVPVTVVGGPASITQLSIVVDITHTFDGDLDIILVAPDGRYAHLSSDNGGTNENFSFTRFTICGSQNITAGTAPYSGNYIPEGGDAVAGGYAGSLPSGSSVASLAAFNGSNSNGNWELWVYDDAGADVGSVNFFAIEFNGQLSAQGPSAPGGSSPSGTMTGTPSPALAGGNVLLKIAVTPGGCPASTGLAVTADLTPIGGSATQAFVDNGTSGDETAGDGIYSYSYAVPGSAAEGTFALNFSITDAQSRSGTGLLNLPVIAPAQWEEGIQGGSDAGDVATTALTVSGSGSLTSLGGNIETVTDVDLFRITISEPANFSATTENPTTGGDTQLWLFTTAGVGITHNDDAGGTAGVRSRLTSANTSSLATGEYILGVSRYNRDPVDAGGALLWNACAGGGFQCETGPTGPGAANPVASWVNNSGTAGVYKVLFTGVSYAGGSTACVADLDDGTGQGNPDGAVTIDDLLFFLVAFENGSTDADVDNGTGTGTRDDAVTVDDLLYFLIRFEAGC